MRGRRGRVDLPPGLLDVRKPPGVTSHDVIDFMRRLTGDTRFGHCGTLDPLAHGVLPVLAGRATRLADRIGDGEKEYRARGSFALRTDTGDLDGTRLGTWEVPDLSREDLEAVLVRFRGDQMQRPHRYSAVKVGGKKLYELAREGKAVEVPPRPIVIHELELVGWERPDITLRVRCSKGTYIRTLIEDIGEALGLGGCLTDLCRTRVGPILHEDSLAPFEIAARMQDAPIESLYVPWKKAFPTAALLEDPDAITRDQIRTGRPLPRSGTASELLVLEKSQILAFYLADGDRWRPDKVFIGESG